MRKCIEAQSRSYNGPSESHEALDLLRIMPRARGV